MQGESCVRIIDELCAGFSALALEAAADRVLMSADWDRHPAVTAGLARALHCVAGAWEQPVEAARAEQLEQWFLPLFTDVARQLQVGDAASMLRASDAMVVALSDQGLLH